MTVPTHTLTGSTPSDRSALGNPLDPSNFNRALKAAAEEAGIDFLADYCHHCDAEHHAPYCPSEDDATTLPPIGAYVFVRWVDGVTYSGEVTDHAEDGMAFVIDDHAVTDRRDLTSLAILS